MSAFLQTHDGDYDFSNHNLKVIKDVATCTAQKLSNRFNFWLAQWYQDIRQGIPYLQNILGVVAPNIGVIAQIFKRVILQTPGVFNVQSASVDYVVGTRQLTAEFKAVADTGAILVGGLGSPFIVVKAGEGQT